jgi:hypothetical protein
MCKRQILENAHCIDRYGVNTGYGETKDRRSVILLIQAAMT